MRILITLVEHPDTSQHLFNAGFDIRFVFPAGGLKHKFKIGIGAAVGQQLEVLKDDAYLTAQKGNVATAYGVQVVIKNTGFASGY